MSKDNKVKLKASDNELFEVEEIVAFESQTIKDMVEDTGTENVIPLLNVSSKILSKVIEYCRFHALEVPKIGDDKPSLSEDDVKAWDAEFVKVDQATLFDLILVCAFSLSCRQKNAFASVPKVPSFVLLFRSSFSLGCMLTFED
jgi:S-phase kinase-associated protein 1